MNLQEVPEERLREVIRMYKEAYDSEPPGIRMALYKGNIFRDSGLEPFYILDMENGSIEVTSAENMDKKLN